MSTEYYQNELYSLRELAADFARENPSLAPHLSGASPDPDVERILEGVAFLTSNIRQKLDDDFPELAQSLMQIIFPHFLRPLPSATIMQFTPKNILQSKITMDAGTFIDSKEVEGSRCRFRTCYPVDLFPMQVAQVRMEDSSGGKKSILVDIDFNKMTVNDWDSNTLRFFIGGDFSGASDLYLLLQDKLSSIAILDEKNNPVFRFDKSALQPMGIVEEQGLIPYPKNAFPAYRLLQEYFLLKEKFLFLELSGFKQWRNRARTQKLILRFEVMPDDVNIPRVNAERFILHATPAINLFDADSEPLLLDHKHSVKRIRPQGGSQSSSVQVYSVNQVQGQSRGIAKRVDYAPVGLTGSSESNVPSYEMSQRLGNMEGQVDSFISISYPADYRIPEKTTVSMKLTCTNGNRPSKLRPGDVSKPTSSTSELVEFANITPPSDFQPAPSGGSVLWRLLSHLSLNYLSIANDENLKALLSLYIFPGLGNKQNEVANQKRIDAISSVVVKAEDRLIKGQIMRGQQIEITVLRENFASDGDYYLFGTVLNRFFASYASLNSYTTMSLMEPSSGARYSWHASIGDRPLL